MRWVTIAVISAAMVVGSTGSANAGVRQHHDDFEGNPAVRWRPVGEAWFDWDKGTARSGTVNGWLHVGGGGPFSSFLETTFATGTGGLSNCSLQIHANPLNSNTQVMRIDVNDTEGKNYVSGMTVLKTGIGYQAVTFNHISMNGYKTIKVRFELRDGDNPGSEWVRLDDFTFSCVY